MNKNKESFKISFQNQNQLFKIYNNKGKLIKLKLWSLNNKI